MSLLFRSLFPLCLVCVLPLVAHAQIKDNDLSRMNQNLRGQDFAIEKTEMQRNQSISMNPLNMQRWENTGGMFERTVAPLEMRPSWEDQSARMSYDIVNFPMKEFEHLNMLEKRANMPNLDQMREIVMVSRYNKANVYELPELLTNYTDMVDEISMQELNRFQFRRNHSTDPGIPVQRAGSGDSANAPRSSSGVPQEAGATQGFNIRPASGSSGTYQSNNSANTQTSTGTRTQAAPMVQMPDGGNPMNQIHYGEKTITVREK